MKNGRRAILGIGVVSLLGSGCFEPRYDWDSPRREEWQEDSGVLREPYWQEGDELLSVERIDILHPQGEALAPRREFGGLVKFVRMRGRDTGNVVRLVEGSDFRLAGVILPSGRTLQFTAEGEREVGHFGYSERAQYHYAIKNILNIDQDIDTRPWNGTVEE